MKRGEKARILQPLQERRNKKERKRPYSKKENKGNGPLNVEYDEI